MSFSSSTLQSNLTKTSGHSFLLNHHTSLVRFYDLQNATRRQFKINVCSQARNCAPAPILALLSQAQRGLLGHIAESPSPKPWNESWPVRVLPTTTFHSHAEFMPVSHGLFFEAKPA